VGGIKEKVLAAKRSGVREIVLPERNRANVDEEVPEELRQGLTFHFVATIDEAIAWAFGEVVPAKASQSNLAQDVPLAARPAQPLPVDRLVACEATERTSR